MRSGNPMLRDDTFSPASGNVDYANNTSDNVMTVEGTVNKSLMMIGLCAITAAALGYHVTQAASGIADPAAAAAAIQTAALPYIIGGAVVGLIIAIVIAVKGSAGALSTSAYAIAEGLFIGGFSAILEAMYTGLVNHAVALTFIIFAIMLTLYRTGIIKVTAKLRAGIVAATLSVMAFYLLAFVTSLFGMGTFSSVLSFQNGGMLSIGISVVIVAIAAFNLLLDFDFIEKGAQSGAPKQMEWYGTFALLVTLVWLYIEVLRLLAKLRNR